MALMVVGPGAERETIACSCAKLEKVRPPPFSPGSARLRLPATGSTTSLDAHLWVELANGEGQPAPQDTRTTDPQDGTYHLWETAPGGDRHVVAIHLHRAAYDLLELVPDQPLQASSRYVLTMAYPGTKAHEIGTFATGTVEHAPPPPRLTAQGVSIHRMLPG